MSRGPGAQDLDASMPIIYRKTAKGAAEIETRAHRLPPRVRSTLILVDGRRADAELAALVPQAADSLAQLAAGGFIEVVAMQAPPAPPPPLMAGAPAYADAAPTMPGALDPFGASTMPAPLGRPTAPGGLGPATGPGGLGLPTRPGSLGAATVPAGLGAATVPAGLGPATAPGTLGPPGAPPTLAPVSGASFQSRRRAVLRAFNDIVGPPGESMAMKMEKAKTVDELRALLPQAIRLVELAQGRRSAEAFAARLDQI